MQEGAAIVNKLQEGELRDSSSQFSLATDVLNSFGQLKWTNIFLIWMPISVH